MANEIIIDRAGGDVFVDMMVGFRHPGSWSVGLLKSGQSVPDRVDYYLYDRHVDSNRSVRLGDAADLIGQTLVLVFTLYRANEANADYYEVKGIVSATNGAVEGRRLEASGTVDRDEVTKQLHAKFSARN